MESAPTVSLNAVECMCRQERGQPGCKRTLSRQAMSAHVVPSAIDRRTLPYTDIFRVPNMPRGLVVIVLITRINTKCQRSMHTVLIVRPPCAGVGVKKKPVLQTDHLDRALKAVRLEAALKLRIDLQHFRVTGLSKYSRARLVIKSHLSFWPP